MTATAELRLNKLLRCSREACSGAVDFPNMNEDKILNKTLQELEGNDWGKPTYNSHLVVSCHRLRRVPLKDFTVEDLRLMIGQKIGLPYLVPLALDLLGGNPLAKGDMYPGDLLNNVFRLPDQFWAKHPELRQKLDKIVEQAAVEIDILGEYAPSALTWLKQELKR